MGWYLIIIFKVIKEKHKDDMTVVRAIANKLVGRSQERKEAVKVSAQKPREILRYC